MNELRPEMMSIRELCKAAVGSVMGLVVKPLVIVSRLHRHAHGHGKAHAVYQV